MTIAQALAAQNASGMDRLDAQLLLLHALGRPQTERAWLVAHDGASLGNDVLSAHQESCRRRLAGEPLAYIVGHREFFGLDLRVDRRVLVPRPDTETLVEWALEVLAATARPRVLDLGTGSGAIALSIMKRQPDALVEASDSSSDALAVARSNAQAQSLEVAFRHGSWLAAAQGTYDLIVSNPPYVAEGDPHLADLGHEPLSALASGPDGLRDIRSIVAGAPGHLKPGAWLLLEHGYDQAGAVRDLLSAKGFEAVASRRDLAGIERCSGAQWLELG
ncbi:MAG: peptide chain release factor N(5)-glutamine methyltransferase [Ramlibacter sp.]